MCGIWFSLGVDAPRSVISSVAHRGPDAEGWEVHPTPAGPLTLGHRRLAILDLTANGQQPMVSPSGCFRIVYNGEIYNYRELRLELESLGVPFRTNCDTEVLLAGYEKYGSAFLDRLNGMFAFVIWDKSGQRIFAARDRFGVKPLYMIRNETGIMFASEIKQFFRMPGLTAHPNDHAIISYLSEGTIDHGSETLFDGIEQVQPGMCVNIDYADDPDNPQVVRRTWYQLHDKLMNSDALGMDMETAADRFLELMTDSVKLRLRSDVTVGSCLSGGLDSSTIVCLARDLGIEGHKTISACYDNWDMDERPYIDAVNKAAGTTSVLTFPDSDGLVREFDDLIAHQDLPVGSSSAYAQWCVFRAAAESGLTVVLDGQGADEQLAGYMPAIPSFHAGLFSAGKILLLHRELTGAARRHDGTVLTWAVAMVNALMRNLGVPGRGVFAHRQPWLSTGYAPPIRRGVTGTLKNLLFDQFSRSTLPALLRYEDRNSMAFGLEARLPFMDYRLVEFVFSLVDDLKIQDGETKAVLRRATRGILPQEVLNRQRKIGFATPEAKWFQERSADLLRDGQRDAQALFPLYFVGDELTRLFAKNHTDPVIRRAQWRILALSRWAQVYGVTG